MDYIREYTSLTPQELRQLSYKRRYKKEVPAWDDSMVRLTQLVCERLIGHPSVLDFGCGHGNFVIDELGPVFSHKVGFDVAAESTTKNISVNEMVIGSGEKLPFNQHHFDLVLSLWVFEHVEKPAQVFQEIFRVLKPGGFFAFVTPHRNSLLILLRRYLSKKFTDRLLKRFYGRDEEDVFDIYYRANTVRDIQRLSKQAGFACEVLIENPDPSYTSFGRVTYLLSKWLSFLPFTLSKPHLIAILRRF